MSTILPEGVEPPKDLASPLNICWQDGYAAAMEGIQPHDKPSILTTPEERAAWSKGHMTCIRHDNHQDQDPRLVALIQEDV